jgi:hypothetical protein
MDGPPMVRSPRIAPARLGIAALLLLNACHAGGRPIPAPLPVPAEQLPEARDRVIELARKEPFDAQPGASDRALLETGEEVTIEPQDGIYRLHDAQLAEGRVVAKFVNHSDKPVRRYALFPKGTSFWVVYQVKGEWLSAYIANSQDRSLDRFNLATVRHPAPRNWRQAIAQWQLPDAYPPMRPGGAVMMRTLATGKLQPWTSCTDDGCCGVPDDDPPPE